MDVGLRQVLEQELAALAHPLPPISAVQHEQYAGYFAGLLAPGEKALPAQALWDFCPRRPRPLSDLSVFHSKLVLYGGFVWPRGRLKALSDGFCARAVRQSALSAEDLKHICELVAPDPSCGVDKMQFALAMHLVRPFPQPALHQ